MTITAALRKWSPVRLVRHPLWTEADGGTAQTRNILKFFACIWEHRPNVGNEPRISLRFYAMMVLRQVRVPL
jgi:hypothetical protein